MPKLSAERILVDKHLWCGEKTCGTVLDLPDGAVGLNDANVKVRIGMDMVEHRLPEVRASSTERNLSIGRRRKFCCHLSSVLLFQFYRA